MTNTERQLAWRNRQREAGFVSVTEWVPREHRSLFRQIAKDLREAKKPKQAKADD